MHRLKPGPRNCVTDVAGVRVGHVTLVTGSGTRAVRTGVTAIVPDFKRKPAAGGHVLNGAGEMTGLTQVREWGLIETPVMLCSTMSVGAVYQGVCQWMAPSLKGNVVIPVVGECDDSYLNWAAGFPVKPEHALQALEEARDARSPEGSVGAGTGMMSFDFKSGIGTASRVADGFTVGALVLSNFGSWENLRLPGADFERVFRGKPLRRDAGSLIAVLATDAPLMPHQLTRLAQRAGLGAARVGSTASHQSGEIFLAFSTTQSMLPRRKATVLPDSQIDPIFLAAVESTEAAIWNSLWAAEEMAGLSGRVAPALRSSGFSAEALERQFRPAR